MPRNLQIEAVVARNLAKNYREKSLLNSHLRATFSFYFV